MTGLRTLRVDKRVGAFAVGLAVAFSVAGCGTSSRGNSVGAKPDPKLTKQVAQDKSIEYLQKTLKALPAGAAFSLHPQNHSLGALTPDIEHQCSDSDAATPGDSPSQMQYSYWLIGVPEGRDRVYVGKINALWHSWGLVRGSGSSSSYAGYTAKDGIEPRQPRTVAVRSARPMSPQESPTPNLNPRAGRSPTPQ